MIIILYPLQISIFFFFALKELFYREQSRVRLNCHVSNTHCALYDGGVYVL